MTNRIRIVIALTGLLVCSGVSSGSDRDTIHQAIEKAQNYLLGHRTPEGTWETDGKGAGPAKPLGRRTCLAAYALQVSGHRLDWDVKAAQDFVLHAKLKDSESIAFQAASCCLVMQVPHSESRAAMHGAMNELISRMVVPSAEVANKDARFWAPDVGFWDVDGPGSRQDRLVSAQAVWAMGALQEEGAEIPVNYWQYASAAWRTSQRSDGGWGVDENANASDFHTTIAAIGALLTVREYTVDFNWSECKGPPGDEVVAKGLHWLDEHCQFVPTDPKTIWCLYRVGRPTGSYRLAGKNWRDECIDYLLQHQAADGSFPGPNGPLADTSCALLFLSQTENPHLMNKLRYTRSAGDQTVLDPWNERPADADHFVHWMGRQLCFLDGNYEVVDVSHNEDLLSAPILYVGGSQSLDFTADERDRLRDYVQHGGLILGNADCGKKAFSDSFKALGTSLFPMYVWKPLSKDDPAYRRMFRRFRNLPDAIELSNGVRKLLVLIPEADLSRSWQIGLTGTREDAFQFGGNLCVYAANGMLPISLHDRLVPTDPSIRATKTLKVARLIVGQNPDPEPYGWQRLAAIMHNTQKIDLQVDPVQPRQLAGYTVAHLTGTGALTLEPGDRDAIRAFVQQGGTLIIDAAGGDGLFANALEGDLTKTLFPNATLDSLPPDDPIYQRPGLWLDSHPWRFDSVVRDPKQPNLRAIRFGNRIGVFFSREDFSAGLAGVSEEGITGYKPDNAIRLMTSMLLYSLEHEKR